VHDLLQNASDLVGDYDYEDEDDLVPAEEERGVVVARQVGDPVSREGREVASRYGHIIGRPLGFKGGIADPMALRGEMMERFPWAHDVVRYVVGQMSVMRMAGQDRFYLPPMLLGGKPGCGKTTILEWLCGRLGAEFQTIPCGGTSDTGGLAAVTRGWSTARASAPVQAMADRRCANPVLILDELDKGSQTGSRNGSIQDAALAMLQNPVAYHDACLLSEVDLSNVSFLASANRLDLLPEALRDRFMIFMVPRPRPEHFDGLLKGVRENEARKLRVRVEMLPWITPDDAAWLRSVFVSQHCSIRALEKAHRLLLGERAADEMEMAARPN